ncbi:NAD-dependent epimerase/dehydratase family protein [Candidatus Pelagibacter sp.]|uniref:NAD-dependent epimerase/dehydratase family protein n=1 Tax=Candidatus Pelagibacter sp. TaxID=2024849 RepID=UPI003F874426
MKNKKIIIFGATGQIGKELSLMFLNNKNIDVISHSRTKVAGSFFKNKNIKYMVGNLLDENILEQICDADLIIDFAAPYDGTLIENKKFYKDRLDILIKNMKINSQFILASSMNAFGIDSNRKVLKNYFFSSSIYASNKRYAEKYVKKLGLKFSIDTFILRLSEVHGNYQRASQNIKKLIYNKYLFEIPKTPAWITFVVLIKEVILNILKKKEKPGTYTVVCDDIYWNDLLEYFGKKLNIKPKYKIVEQQPNIFFKAKKFIFDYLLSKKDIIRGNFNIKKNFEDSMKLNFRIKKAHSEFCKINEAKIYSEYNRYSGVLPGKRIKSLVYDIKILLE